MNFMDFGNFGVSEIDFFVGLAEADERICDFEVGVLGDVALVALCVVSVDLVFGDDHEGWGALLD